MKEYDDWPWEPMDTIPVDDELNTFAEWGISSGSFS